MGRVLLSALPEEQLEVTLSRATLTLRIPCAICPVYVQRSPGCAGLCPRRPADRSEACARWRYRAVASRSGGGRPECQGTCRDGQRRGVKRRLSPARRWICRCNYSDCGFARWRGCARSGQQQKQYTRRRQHQAMSLNKAVFAAAISACATRRAAPGTRLTSPIDDAACCAMAPLRPDDAAWGAVAAGPGSGRTALCRDRRPAHRPWFQSPPRPPLSPSALPPAIGTGGQQRAGHAKLPAASSAPGHCWY